ncbi:hypothetical protein ACMS1Z_10285 [Acidiphilium multivorum]|uniref:hypothetical protein n=1 Tax=Acidiphilium multivorum TaxID=62140 RepID=UPI0039C9294A
MLNDGKHRVTVRVSGDDDYEDRDSIVLLISHASVYASPVRGTPGFDTNAIGAWPEKGLHGGQLGPNKNGKKW